MKDVFKHCGLTHQEQRIVRLRFGLDGRPLRSQEIVDRIGLSRYSLGKIQSEALRKLRRGRPS